jgi:hypothetical protein
LVTIFFSFLLLLFLLLLLVASCRCEEWMDQRQACLRDLSLAEDIDLGLLSPRTHLVLVLVLLSQSTATGGSWEAPPASGCHSPLQLRGWGCQNGEYNVPSWHLGELKRCEKLTLWFPLNIAT